MDLASNTIVGEVCHIRADSPGGPRYDANQSEVERQAFDNLVLLCSEHHKIIDAPAQQAVYTSEVLQKYKLDHERSIQASAPALMLTEQQVRGLLESIDRYARESIHMDFRQAVFKVGGEGGGLGGGGGSGGILTIIGTTRIPTEADVRLNGEDGRAPGAGGGGAGGVQFIGRNLEAADFSGGFDISSFFGINSCNGSRGMFNVLGGGWSYWQVDSLPNEIEALFLAVFELGDVAPATLIKTVVEVVDANGTIVGSGSFDVEAGNEPDTVRRSFGLFRVRFTASSVGRYKAQLTSGATPLASYPFDVKLRQ